MGVELFHAEGRTDRHTEANNRFSKNLKTRLELNFNISAFRHVIPKFRRKRLAPSAQDFYILKMKATSSVNTFNKCVPHYTASNTRRHVLHTHGRDSLESLPKKKNLFASLILSRI